MRDPQEFAVDHEVMSAADHFKLLTIHLDANKHDFVAREYRAAAIAAKIKRGLPQSSAIKYGQYYDKQKEEAEAFADHIGTIREMMFEVWQKLTNDERREFSKFEGDLAEPEKETKS